MPNPLPQDALRLEKALVHANWCRQWAAYYRRTAAVMNNSKPLLDAAAEYDAKADAIMTAMKEGNGHG